MIYLSDLSVLMQNTIAKDITFMVSKSGIPNYYNLHFAKYIDGKGNQSVRLNYHEEDKQVWQYADGEHGVEKFDTVDGVLDYVIAEMIK